jgi:mono/diheme cytochrome c family protein
MRAGTSLLVMLALLVGCDDMTTQPRQKQYSPEAGPAQQPKGVVEYDKKPVPAPPLTLALLQRGQEQFRIYCTPCHSELGDGDGMVVQRGFPHPPSFHSALLRDAPTQHFYDVITNGFGVMYSYAARVEPSDRWAIAAYIRALQLSQRTPVADLSADQRKALP